jgi:hypothetical protein
VYAEHVPQIAAAMRGSTEGFARGVLFSVCSIRQPIVAIPEQLAEVEREGPEAKALFGFKRSAYAYLREHADTLRREVLAADWNGARFATLLRVPGLGIVKSGFVLQLMGYDVACLDTRNVRREGRDYRAFRTDGKAPDKLRNKVALYLLETQGKAEHYWNAWCEEVAADNNLTPLAVSALHLSIVRDDPVPF